MEKCVIIGAGPAGISASLYLARSNIVPLVIYKDCGALKNAHKIANYYGLEKDISGAELFENGIKQAKNLGVKLAQDEVVSVSYDGNYIVDTAIQSFSTETIIIATGSSRKRVDIKGLSDLEGKGVSYCAICDSFFYKDKEVAVIGNTNFALHEAQITAQVCSKVYILTNGKKAEFETDDEKIKVIDSKILSINGESKVESVTLETNKLSVDGVFVALGSASSSDIARHIGAQISENGLIKVDDDMATTVSGIYAAGDCVGGLLQVTKAVTDGAKAALAITKFLKEKNNV